MRSALRRMGNSTGLIVPKPVLAAAGVQNGAVLDLVVEDGRIIANPLPRAARAGWAEAARAVATEPEASDETAWRNIGLETDAALEW